MEVSTFRFEDYKTKVDFLDLKWNCYSYEMIAWWSILNNKEWEIRVSNFIEYYHEFYPIKCFLDIGANFGYHSLVTARLIKESGGIVHAFEPQIQNFALLESNIADNDMKNVHVYNYACGNVKEKVKMPIIHYFKSTPAYAFNVNMGDFTPNFGIDEEDESTYETVETIILDDLN
jgi:FkbM family methyltransferase